MTLNQNHKMRTIDYPIFLDCRSELVAVRLTNYRAFADDGSDRPTKSCELAHARRSEGSRAQRRWMTSM